MIETIGVTTSDMEATVTLQISAVPIGTLQGGTITLTR